MAKFIAHRGNTTGPKPDFENTIDYMRSALNDGYDVECDLIMYDNQLYFGHDEPQEAVDLEFIHNSNVWCHAKNLDAMCVLIEMNTNAFWHQNDNITITTRNYIWCFPGIHINSRRAIWLDLHDRPLPNKIENIHAICGDVAV